VNRPGRNENDKNSEIGGSDDCPLFLLACLLASPAALG